MKTYQLCLPFSIARPNPPHPPGEQIRAGWQTSETDPVDDVTQGHTQWRGGGGGEVGTALSLASCSLIEQVKEGFL